MASCRISRLVCALEKSARHEPRGARLRRALISIYWRSGLDGVSPHRSGKVCKALVGSGCSNRPLRQTFRECLTAILPGGVESRIQHILLRRCEIDVRCAALSPNAATRVERAWRLLDERALLFWRQLHHPPAFVRVAERREDLSFDAKVRVFHVRCLDRSTE